MALSDTDKASALFKYIQRKSSTDNARQFFEEPNDLGQPILSRQIWNQSDDIPATAPVLADQVTSGVVKYWDKLSLTLVPGTTNAFRDANLQDAIPFNIDSAGSYNFSLFDSLSNPIFFGQGDWIVDLANGVVTFYGTLPANMPPQISFYQYVGTKGAGGAGIDTVLFSVVTGNPLSDGGNFTTTGG